MDFISLQKIGSNAKVGFSKAMSNGWIRRDKTAEGGARVYREVLYVCTHTRAYDMNPSTYMICIILLHMWKHTHTHIYIYSTHTHTHIYSTHTHTYIYI